MPVWHHVLEEVLRDRRSALVGYAALFTLDRVDAEDLVHDAIVRTFARPRALTDVYAAEGYVRGTITPFGSLTAWPVVADSRIRTRTVSIGGGAHGVAATVDGAELVKALDATVADVTEPEPERATS